MQGKKGSVIGDRFEVQQDVGLGTFGRVVECYDLKRKRRVAVKVVRKVWSRALFSRVVHTHACMHITGTLVGMGWSFAHVLSVLEGWRHRLPPDPRVWCTETFLLS